MDVVRIGRKLVFGVTLAGLGLFGVVGAFSPNFYVYMTFRFLVAMNSIGAYASAFILGEIMSFQFLPKFSDISCLLTTLLYVRIGTSWRVKTSNVRDADILRVRRGRDGFGWDSLRASKLESHFAGNFCAGLFVPALFPVTLTSLFVNYQTQCYRFSGQLV